MNRSLALRGGPWIGLAGAMLFAAGCAHADVTSAQLPLRRVVIYRNGVGYFERAGHVEADQVTFKMRQKMVGDFLATLAIVERGGSSVRSASFPMEIDKQAVPPGPDPEFQYRLDQWTKPPAERPDPERLREVVLRLDGQEHDLAVGYVAATPLWRPSYRLVVRKDGGADLQVWGIVQNLSGEDWKDVKLALIAGAPIAFESTLGQPVTPERPVVTDTGEVVSSVPEGMTSLKDVEGPVDRVAPSHEATPPPPSAPAPAAEARGAPEETKPAPKAFGNLALRGGGGGAPMKKEKGGEGYSFDEDAAAEAPQAPEPVSATTPSAPRNLKALAAVALATGTTRYEIPVTVSVPNESATMVLLLNERVKGEAVFLFAPDPGVADSSSHPFRVARFLNQSKGLLERGPIAVFEQGSFLGQGLLDALPPNATATVPFALERSLAIESTQKWDQQGAWIDKIEGGQLTIQRDSVLQTSYKVKNGADDSAKLLVRHPRQPGSRLYKPPPGTEDNTGTGSALVPISVRAHARAELVVEERQSYQQPVDWLDPLADEAVQRYLKDPRANAVTRDKLSTAWTLRTALEKLRDEQSSLDQQQGELGREAEETRRSLRAIEKNPQAAALRATLTKRLGDVGVKMDAITKRLVEIKMNASEQEVRFRDAVRTIKLLDAPPPEH